MRKSHSTHCKRQTAQSRRADPPNEQPDSGAQDGRKVRMLLAGQPPSM